VRIVGENSEADLLEREVRAPVDACLRELTANLLRVIRGAGKPYLIARQVFDLTEAIALYQSSTGRPISTEVLSAIPSLTPDPGFRTRYGDFEADWRNARQLVVQGALQLLASELLDQRTQAAAGDHEVTRGLYAFERLRAERRTATRAAKPAVQRKVGTKRMKDSPRAKRTAPAVEGEV
jgi:hypothetical protein